MADNRIDKALPNIIPEETLPKDQERYFSYVGRKAETYGLPEGVYRGSVTVKRDGEELLSDVDTIRVNSF